MSIVFLLTSATLQIMVQKCKRLVQVVINSHLKDYLPFLPPLIIFASLHGL